MSAGEYSALVSVRSTAMCTARAAGVPRGGVEQRLELLARRVLGDRVARRPWRRLRSSCDVAGRRLGVDAAQQRHVQVLEEAGEHLVGLDHEHLDERVREGVVLAARRR